MLITVEAFAIGAFAVAAVFIQDRIQIWKRLRAIEAKLEKMQKEVNIMQNEVNVLQRAIADFLVAA